MKNGWVIAIMMVLGCCMLPGVASACHLHGSPAASCCQKATVRQSANMQGPEAADPGTVPHKSCEGQCDQTSCQCGAGSVFVAWSPGALSDGKGGRAEKQPGVPFDAPTITGFSFIWLPPKIS